MENVSPNAECQPRFAVFHPNLPHLLMGNNTCPETAALWGITAEICRRSGQCCDQTPASPSSPSETPIISSRNVEKIETEAIS